MEDKTPEVIPDCCGDCEHFKATGLADAGSGIYKGMCTFYDRPVFSSRRCFAAPVPDVSARPPEERADRDQQVNPPGSTAKPQPVGRVLLLLLGSAVLAMILSGLATGVLFEAGNPLRALGFAALFPLGLSYFFAYALGEPGLLLGYLVYVGLVVWAILARGRPFFRIVLCIWILALLANIGGCILLVDGMGQIR